MKRILSILLTGLMVLALVGCGSNNKAEKTTKVEETKVEVKEINKNEYEKADFVKFNLPEQEYFKMVGTKVYIEGEASSIDLEGKIFAKSPNLIVSQKESNGFGMYGVEGYSIRDADIDINQKDNVRVYGIIFDQKINGMPTILVDKIEKI